MERYALSENDAFHRLRRAAMDSRRPMVEVARALLVVGVSGRRPAYGVGIARSDRPR